MKIKIRQKHEDFVVKEIINTKKYLLGKYYLYELTKENINTLQAISYIAKKFNIPLKYIGFCGLKDKHAITTQYITIPKKFGKIEINEPKLKLKCLYPVRNKLKIGDLIGNYFKIVVRNIKENYKDKILENIEILKKYGAPNYFDSQRFGSVFDNKFIIKEYILGNYENGIKIFLTKYKKSENKKIKDLKRFINENWGKWEKILKYMKEKNIKNKTFLNIISFLERTNDFKESYKFIDKRLLQLFTSAYQSYLWNECIKEIIRNNSKRFKTVEYACGELYFHDCYCNFGFEYFPTIVPDKEYSEDVLKVINKVLKQEKIKISDLNKVLDLNCMFYYSERKVIIYPNNFKHSEFLSDELNKSRCKMILEFELPKGSYATIIIKRIFQAL